MLGVGSFRVLNCGFMDVFVFDFGFLDSGV